MRIATISLDQKWCDKQKNIERCLESLDCLNGLNVDLAIFPEMTLTGFCISDKSIIEDIQKSESIRFFSDAARKYNLGIIFGLLNRQESTIFNSLVMINRSGIVSAVYNKIHTFSHAGECNVVQSGSEYVIDTIEGFPLGFSICYDLRFPELYTGLAKNCFAIVNIANWPSARVDHWKTLLKARSIENQVWVIGVNRTGQDGNGLSYCKSSVIYGPNGKKVTAKRISNVIDLYLIEPLERKCKKNVIFTSADRKIDIYKKNM